MALERYYLATVADNEDPDKRGALSLVIPQLSGDEEVFPEWIPARVVGASNGAIALFWVPPVESVVYVEADRTTGELRWLGSELGQLQDLPAILAANYPARVGFTSNGAGVAFGNIPGRVHGLVLDQDDGLRVEVVDGASTYTLTLTTGSVFEARLAAAKLVRWLDSKAELIHSGGVEAKASAASVVFPVVKNTINTPLANALTEAIAACTALAIPSPNLAAVVAALNAGTYDAVTLKTD